MPMDYKQYQEEVTADVAKIIADASCQPILFIGSGFTKRYAKGPNWEELLGLLAKNCPLIDKDFAYYKQAHGNDLTKIGTVFSQLYHEWAWNAGKKNFPQEYFAANTSSDIFIKHAVADILEPPRVLRRLFSLRGLSHEQEVEPVFTRGPRTRCSHGA
jgi:hypothetical protein